MAERDRLLSGYWGNTQSGVRIPPSPPKNSFARESGQKSFFFIRSVRDLLTLYHTEPKALKNHYNSHQNHRNSRSENSLPQLRAAGKPAPAVFE